MLVSSVLALTLSLAGVQATPLYERAAPTVSTSDGSTFVGKASSSVESFLGIPFAQPPVGALRFAAPVPMNGPLGTFDATRYGFACPQMNIINGVLPGLLNGVAQQAVNILTSSPAFTTIASSNTSEDCLSLNIQRPAGVAASAKLPVMLWIYGGAFVLGGSGMYDGSSIVARSVARGQPVIFASMNYRLNAFGFLPGKEARGEDVSTNAGLLDQRLAMEWLQSYIADFGGDPDKVTIFGESAGAISVAFQLQAKDGDITSERTGKPLFRAAIMESGGPIPVEGPERGQASFDTIARATGCLGVANPIACLRAVPYPKLMDAISEYLIPNILSYRSVSLPFLPRTDGVFLRSLTQDAMPSGKFARVPIISGNQYDEGTILALGTLNITTSAQFSEWLREVYFPNTTPAQRARLLELYPQDVTQGSPFDTGILNVLTPQNKRINAIVGDVVFQVCRRFFLAFTYPVMPTWSYVSRTLGAVPLVGSFHASDIISVFGLTGPFVPLTIEMQSRWLAFANNLDPNVPGYAYWPTYQSNSTLLQFSDFPSKLIFDNFRKPAIDYLWSIVDSLTL